MRPSSSASLGSIAVGTNISSYSTVDISFAFASSLAVAKNHLSWEQTPWLLPKISHGNAHRIHQISLLDRDIGKRTLLNAFCLGSIVSPENIDNSDVSRPLLYCAFPHLKCDVTQPEFSNIFRVWHEKIVRPAFCAAWEEVSLHYPEHLVEGFQTALNIWGDMQGSITGTTKFQRLHAYRNLEAKPVYQFWPCFKNTAELENDELRAKIYDEAWKSIRGMVEGHPSLQGLRDMFLIVLWKPQMVLEGHIAPEQMYKAVGECWDRLIDARYVEPNSFKVLLNEVLAPVDNGPEIHEEKEEAEHDDEYYGKMGISKLPLQAASRKRRRDSKVSRLDEDVAREPPVTRIRTS